MADKIVIELDLEKGDVTKATSSLEKSAEKAGNKAGKGFADNFNSNLAKNLGNLTKTLAKTTVVAAGAAVAIGTIFAVKSVRAAQIQEDAVNSLNSALSISKNASIAASEGIQAFASELQQSTRFGDEVLLQNAALIQSLGDLDANGLKRATTAAADLATALRIDLASAATLVGKAAAGEVGSFSRYGLTIKKGADNAETFAKALTAIESKFGGASQRDVVTYSGSVEQLSNAYGDVLEKVGEFITNNPSVIKAVKEAKKFFEQIQKTLGDNSEIIERLVNQSFTKFINGAGAVASAVVKLTNLVNQFNASLAKNESDNYLEKLQDDLKNIQETSADFVDPNTGKKIVTFAEKTLLAEIEAEKLKRENRAKQLEEENVFFENLVAVIDNGVKKIAQKQAENNPVERVAEANQAVLDNVTASSIGVGEVYSSVYDGLVGDSFNAADGIEAANAKIIASTQKVGLQLRQGLATGAANAFAEFGKAAVEGGNAFEAFGKSIFKSIAQQAVTLGTNFILQGTAMLFSPFPEQNAKAPGLIANGAALAAFGGALGAASGGGGASASGGSSSSSNPNVNDTTPGFEELASPDQQTRAEERTNVTLNIEGSLIRESELSGYVADLLETAGSSNSTIIPSLRTGVA